MKMKNILNRVPRPVKACVCAALVIMLAVVYYIALGCPTLTIKQEFRRAEKAHLIGPSTIVDTLSIEEYEEFDRLLVGESAQGITFFGRYRDQHPYENPLEEKQHYLHYVEKTGDMTLCAAPNVWGVFWENHGFRRTLPVYLFVEDPRAVRAEVSITVIGYRNPNQTDPFEVNFRGDASRSKDRFFRFTIHADQGDSLQALFYLSSLTGGNTSSVDAAWNADNITAVVRLYDNRDQLITERTLTLWDALA